MYHSSGIWPVLQRMFIKSGMWFRNKPILENDLNAKHSVWSDEFSKRLRFETTGPFVNYDFEISAIQIA
jgi:hypothetical protein